MTIIPSMSCRLFLFLIQKTLRPGPACAESATPAAGPGENLGGHSVGARPATAGCLRACAGQGCGPHGSKEPKNDATSIAVNHCSAPSAAFPFSDCSFTPAAGYRHPASGALSHVGTEGDLWSSSPYVSDGSGASRAGSIHFSASSMFMLNITDRASALSVRCVQASARIPPQCGD